MGLKRIIFAACLLLASASSAAAQDRSPLSIVSVRQYGDGIDRVFEFTVANALDRPVTARGRAVLIGVYDASLPETIQIREVTVPAGGMTTVVVRWENAPLIGQIRALVVLNDGQHDSLVESFTFWILPLKQGAAFLGITALTAAFALAVMRLPGHLKARVPPGMTAYIVEYDDTVMTLSNRFEVNWQEIVRLNRLKPPYGLKPGSRLLLPKHALHRPDRTPKA